MGAYANLIFLVLWVGFVTALIVNREWLDVLWNWAQALPLVPKIIVWVLILPIMVGLWIWESSWPLLGSLVGFTGIVAWTLLAVYSLIRDFRQI
jgi:polyferredoxin